MKKTFSGRTILIPCAISVLLMFVACGHSRNRASSDAGEGGDLFAGMRHEEAAPVVKPEEEAKDKKSLDDILSEAAQKKEETPVAEAPKPEEPKKDIAELEPIPQVESNPTPVAEAPASEAEPVVAAAMPPTLEAASVVPDAAPPALVSETTEAAPAPVVAETPAPASEPLIAQVTEPAAEEAQTEEVTTPSEGKPRAAHAQLQQLPSEPLTLKGQLLNRYYILRTGDTQESTALLLLGNPERAKDLAAWNEGAWKTGRVIYYTSPEKPQDASLLSFYEERSIPAKEYTVQRGDWLSTISKDAYGNIESWKEIALVNRVSSPDEIVPGLTLKLYPQTLKEFAYVAPAPEMKVAEAAPVERAPAAVEAPAPEAVKVPEQTVASAPVAPVAKADKHQEVLANPEMGSFFVNHLFILSCLAGALGIGLVVWFGFLKRKKSDSEL